MAKTEAEQLTQNCLTSLRQGLTDEDKIIMASHKVPREVVFGDVHYVDETPNAVFPSMVYDSAPDVVQVVYNNRDECFESPDYVSQQPEEVVRISKEAQRRLKDFGHLHSEAKMTLRPQLIAEFKNAIMLPLKEDGNQTGFDYLPYGHPLMIKFFRLMTSRLMEVSTTDFEVQNALHLVVDYSAYSGSTLQIAYNSAYDMGYCVPKWYWDKYAELMETYLSECDKVIAHLIENDPSEFSMSMKIYRSPGTDLEYRDGQPFEKEHGVILPAPSFGTTEYNSKNAWQKISYYALKVDLAQDIVPSFLRRAEGLNQGLMGDPKWETDMALRGDSRDKVYGWRGNNPDSAAIYSLSKPDEKEHDVEPGEQMPAIDDDMGWIKIQGKPREVSFYSDVGTLCVKFVAPLANALEFNKRTAEAQKKPKGKNKDGSPDKRTPRKRFMTWLRRRGILPHRWRLNMFDGTIAKVYTEAMEKCRVGFPNTAEGAPFAIYMGQVLSTYAKGRVHVCMDVSHFEILFSSMMELQTGWGLNPRRQLYEQDSHRGWIATNLGRQFIGVSTSSGQGATSQDSLFSGQFINAIHTAMLASGVNLESKEAKQAFEDQIKFMLANALEFLSEKHPGAGTENVLSEWSNSPPEIAVGGHRVRVHPTQGSDDQMKYIESDELNDDKLTQLIDNPKVEEEMERVFHTSVDVGFATSFGVRKERDAIYADAASSFFKLFLAEKERNGDMIALSLCLSLAMNPQVAEVAQWAADQCGFGNLFSSYSRGARNAVAILDHNNELCQDWLEANYPSESPKHEFMASVLSDSGFALGKTQKISPDITREIFSSYLTFIGKPVFSNQNTKASAKEL